MNTYVWKMEMDTVRSLSFLNLVTVIGRITFSHIDCKSDALKLYALGRRNHGLGFLQEYTWS